MPNSEAKFLVTEIPDPYFSRYQLAAGGDVRQAIWGGWEILARAVSQFPSGSVSLSIKAMFNPHSPNDDVQERLQYQVTAESEDSSLLEELRLLIEQGFLSNYYAFRQADDFSEPNDTQTNTCQIVRRTDFIKPLHAKQFNDRIPESYYSIIAFEARADNDYLALDKVLNTIPEPVKIELRVEPVDLAQELNAHTRYLSVLQSINRSWDQDDFEYDWPSVRLMRQNGESVFNQGPREIKPLRKSDPLADSVLRSQQKIHESLSRPHLLFTYQVTAKSKAVAHLVATVAAESAFGAGSYKLLLTPAESLHPDYGAFERMPYLATVEELSGAFRMPIASYASPLCIRKTTDPSTRSERAQIVFGHDQALLPALVATGTGAKKMGLALIGAAKHGFVCGMSGYGKTTEIMHIAIQFTAHGVPVLIIEPVKTEHRLSKTLKDSHDSHARRLAESLEIFTPGNESISPFRLNCFESYPGVGLDEHIGNLMSCFMGAMPSTPFLPMILEEALERVYEDHDLVDNPPLMDELIGAVRQVIAEKGYSGETLSDIRAASELRLASLSRGAMGKVFQCRHSVPSIDRLISRPSLIELDHLSAEKASLVTLFLLMSIRERLLSIPKTGDGLRVVIILEEAHNLVGRTGPARASEEAADPKAFAAEAICRMLVEFRALEVGMIIVDQHPSAVAPEVVKATGTKLAFRQVAEEDRLDLGASMLLGDLEVEEIARLKPGEAYFYTEGLHGPRRIQTPNLHERFDLSKDVIRGAIIPHIEKDSWLLELGIERSAEELAQLKEALDRYDRDWLGLIEKLNTILHANTSMAPGKQSSSGQTAAALRQKLQGLKGEMVGLFSALEKGPYRRFLTEANPKGFEDPAVAAFRDSLVGRFEKTIKTGFQDGIALIEQLLTSKDDKPGV